MPQIVKDPLRLPLIAPCVALSGPGGIVAGVLASLIQLALIGRPSISTSLVEWFGFPLVSFVGGDCSAFSGHWSTGLASGGTFSRSPLALVVSCAHGHQSQ
jgi:hypothetical protein